MNQGELKSNDDPIVLKQTIIYLRSELNKYKNKNNSSSLVDELLKENERLTNKYKDLLHQNKKNEKRLQLYEQRIRSLESQRTESLTALERLQYKEQDLRAVNKQLYEVLGSLGNDRNGETAKIIERLEMKVDSLFHQYPTPENKLSLAESKLANLQLELEKAQNINAQQYELIGILEEYIQQLTEEAQAYDELTDYLTQKINSLSSE